MLPSMPIISTPVRSPLPDSSMEEEDLAPSSTSGEFPAEDMSREKPRTPPMVLKSPRRSPCPDLTSLKKSSPLKHVTPILRKYSVHRKAKTSKKMQLNLSKGDRKPCVMVTGLDLDSEICLSPPSPAEEEEEEPRTPSPILEMEVEEPVEEDLDPPSSPLDMKDSEEELAALMRASSAVGASQRSRPPPTAPPAKRSRHARELEASLGLLQPEDPAAREERENTLAVCYFNKVREELTADGEEGEERFQQFVEVLGAAEATLGGEGGVARLYSQVCAALEGHPHLASEFLVFLEPGQALACRRFSEHAQLSDMADLIVKLETFFARQPHLVRLVLSCLSGLAEQPEVTELEVRAAVLPLLRANPLLADCFLRLLPGTRPPECMMTDFEQLVCEEGEGRDEDEPVENLQAPEEDARDLYGGDSCVCPCHSDTEDERFRTRADHCTPCGLKFIHGKIYLQTGKTLRPAKVSFLNEDIHSAIRRLTVFSNSGRNSANRCRKRTGNSFSQDPANNKDSPPKLNLDDSDNEDGENYRTFSDLSSPKSSRTKSKKPKEKHFFSKLSSTDKAEEGEYSKELLVRLSPEIKDVPLLSPTGSSSCDTIPECRLLTTECDSLELQEPDSTVVCDEESTELTEELEEEEEEEDLDLEELEEEEEDDEEGEPLDEESSQEALSCEAQLEPKPEPLDDESNQEAVSSEPEPRLESLDEESSQEAMSSEPEPKSLDEEYNQEAISNEAQPEPVEEEFVKPVVRRESPEVSTSEAVVEERPSSSQRLEESPQSSSISDPCWTRDEDKAILEAFQQGGTAQRMLLAVRQMLPERTPEQIMRRFQILLKLLQQMSSAKRDDGKKGV